MEGEALGLGFGLGTEPEPVEELAEVEGEENEGGGAEEVEVGVGAEGETKAGQVAVVQLKRFPVKTGVEPHARRTGFERKQRPMMMIAAVVVR